MVQKQQKWNIVISVRPLVQCAFQCTTSALNSKKRLDNMFLTPSLLIKWNNKLYKLSLLSILNNARLVYSRCTCAIDLMIPLTCKFILSLTLIFQRLSVRIYSVSICTLYSIDANESRPMLSTQIIKKQLFEFLASIKSWLSSILGLEWLAAVSWPGLIKQ